MNDTEELIRELPQGLIRWYPFEENTEKLFVLGGIEECDVLAEVFPKADTVDVSALDTLEKQYDYIIGAGIIERGPEPTDILRKLGDHLKSTGVFLLFAENRLAIKYFCGEKDYFSNRVFDGIENYAYFPKEAQEHVGGRAYSKAEIARFLTQAQFQYQFYSIFPSLVRPQLFIAENYLPKENLDIRIFPQYRSPDTVFLEEEHLYDNLAANGLLHGMANGFLVECTMCATESRYMQITVSPDRGHQNALATILNSDKSVIKKPLFPEGKGIIGKLYENNAYLKAHGIPMIEMERKENFIEMPLVEYETALVHFRRLFLKSIPALLKELECFWEYIAASSEHVDYQDMNWEQFEPGWEKGKSDDPTRNKWKKLAEGTKEQRDGIGIILKRGYVDLVALNCFYHNGNFWFYDQENYIENFPAKAILLRTIDTIYMNQPNLCEIYPPDRMLEHFGLEDHATEWRKFTWSFLEPLRNEKPLANYHRLCRRDDYVIRANRQRMNYSQENYDRYFGNIFRNTDGKKIYLFGSGRFTKRFLDKYGTIYEIAGLIDNARQKWGKRYEGIEIFPPEKLKAVTAPYKVFICIKEYQKVLEQLLDMGIREIAVFDPMMEYELPRKEKVLATETEVSKKYHVGYVAGVFDLFHIGHLNLLRRAKEQCRYLIVGVVTDEQVMKEKRTMPVIPFEERLEIVQACRYVDEAVKIPIDRPSTEDAYRMYHFDVQFSGNDYENDTSWLTQKTYLQQHGADIVFFPYTQSVSSTRLKQQLRGEGGN